MLDGHVAHADEVELALLAQVLELAELLGQRDGRPGAVVEQPQVDEVHALDLQRAQVVLDAGAQLGRALGRQPRALRVAARTDLRDELQALGVRVQGLADEVVDDVGTVVLRGVDVVDAELDRAPEHGAGGVGVARRPDDVRTGELHGAEAHPVDGLVAEV